MDHAMRLAGLVCFGLAALWPALPTSAQGLKINLTALGLLLEFGAAYAA